MSDRLLTRFAVGLLGAAVLTAPALAADEGSRPPPSITVEGRASRDVPPDLAVITIGVATERPTALDAATSNAKAAQSILGELRASGIAAADVATTEATLAPVYDNPRDNQPPRIRGYRAANSVSVRVHKLESTGDLAGRLIDKGANTLEGVDFIVSEPEPVLNLLRADATRDAKRRATLYVEAAGVRLGRILSIQPGSPPSLDGRMFKLAVPAPAPAAGPTVPLAAGVQRLEEHVSITWALEEP